MNEAEVANQISQMVEFIRQEATEKAAEIKLKAEEEYMVEKLRLVEAEKVKIRAEYERKEKQVEVQKSIEQSNEVRVSRLKTLSARDQAMQSILKEAEGKLPALKTGSGYPKLLENLITEALKQLCDQKVSVKPVAGEEKATTAALKGATTAFTKWATDEMGSEWAAGIDVKMSSETLSSGIAGVQVIGMGGKITLTNTLESRLALAFSTYLPQLRSGLFD